MTDDDESFLPSHHAQAHNCVDRWLKQNQSLKTIQPSTTTLESNWIFHKIFSVVSRLAALLPVFGLQRIVSMTCLSLHTKVPACRLTTQLNFMNDMCVAFFLLLRCCLKGSCTQLSSCSMRCSNVEKIGGVWSQSCSPSYSLSFTSRTTRTTSRLCLGRARLLHRSYIRIFWKAIPGRQDKGFQMSFILSDVTVVVALWCAWSFMIQPSLKFFRFPSKINTSDWHTHMKHWICIPSTDCDSNDWTCQKIRQNFFSLKIQILCSSRT